MLIIPAIDLKDGCVVRLRQGKAEDKTIYSFDAVKIARQWKAQGAGLIHIVDLDGAFSGRPKNISLVKKILKSIDTRIEFGGGVRNLATIKALLDLGVYRVALGTRAIEDPVFLTEAFKKFKNKIIVSIDAQSGRMKTKGWKKDSKEKDLISFARSLGKIGFKRLIYTDTLKDGTLTGPDIKGVTEILKKTGLKVIASGGVSSLGDLVKLSKLERYGLEGVIVGKALYEGRFTLKEALGIN